MAQPAVQRLSPHLQTRAQFPHQAMSIGIYNATDSTITTLNNSQGASSSALTYDWKTSNQL